MTVNEAYDLVEHLERLQEDIEDMRYLMADVPGAEHMRLEVAARIIRAHGLARKALDHTLETA